MACVDDSGKTGCWLCCCCPSDVILETKQTLSAVQYFYAHAHTNSGRSYSLGLPNSFILLIGNTSSGWGFQHVSTIPISPSRTGWSSRQGLCLSSAPLALLPHAKVPGAVHFCSSISNGKTWQFCEVKDVNSGHGWMFNNQQLWGKLAKSRQYWTLRREYNQKSLAVSRMSQQFADWSSLFIVREGTNS